MRGIRSLLLATTALVSLSLAPALANPLESNVIAGGISISGTGSPNLTVTQSTDKAIIDWRSFDIGTGETTQFVQPSSASVSLNRVTGGEGASQILGTLKANGQVFLVNPDGILFGKDSQVDVGGLIATSNDISNSDFLSGNYVFGAPGSSSASVVNLGTITAADGGFAALVAPGVRNAGTITAKLGNIDLSSADGFTLDFYGDDLIKLAVDDVTAGTVIDVSTGKPLGDLAGNSGLLKADGGTVRLTAAAARAVVDSVINNSGTIEANSVGLKNGKIVLSAATASTKPASAPVQKVAVSGTVSASGINYGEAGGKVEITGEQIALTEATIDTFGWKGGGTVLIGGDYRGGTPDPADLLKYGVALENHVVPNASEVLLDQDTTISANALGAGNGGKVIVWSEGATQTAATIAARGGPDGGHGGFIETSGGYLDVLKAADASAAEGTAGTWLLDPYDVYVAQASDLNRYTDLSGSYLGINGVFTYPTGTPSIVDTATVEASLNTGTNVILTTKGTGGTGNGDITILDDIHKTAGGNATVLVESARNVYIASGFDLTSTSGALNVGVLAPNGTISGTDVGYIGLDGGSLYLGAADGIDLHSNYDMPNLYLGNVPNIGIPLPGSVNISFDGDQVKLTNDGTTAIIPTNGIQLIDSTARSSLNIDFGALNFVLQDYAVRVTNNRFWSLSTAGAFGASTSSAFNKVPEVISDGNVSTQFNATMPQVNGIYPVWEVQSTNAVNCRTLTCLPTSPYGQSLLEAVLNPPPVAVKLDMGVAGSTPMVLGEPTDANNNNTPPLPVPTDVSISPSVELISIGGAPILPLGQLDASLYASSGPQAIDPKGTDTTGASPVEIDQEMCLATVYLMIAHAYGDKTATIGDEVRKSDYMAVAKLPKGVTVDARTSIPLDSLYDVAKKGTVSIIGTSQEHSSHGIENHFMLVVGTDSRSHVLIANDPWTGTQVEISTVTGGVVAVMGPSGAFVNIVDPATGAAYETLPPNIAKTLSNVSSSRYGALPSFVVDQASEVKVSG